MTMGGWIALASLAMLAFLAASLAAYWTGSTLARRRSGGPAKACRRWVLVEASSLPLLAPGIAAGLAAAVLGVVRISYVPPAYNRAYSMLADWSIAAVLGMCVLFAVQCAGVRRDLGDSDRRLAEEARERRLAEA